jgi:hypothetical protein
MADGMIRFTLDGTRHELSRAVVEARLSDVLPELVRKHAVRVNDTWFPVIQAFEAATGISRSEFISHTARRHLAALGFEVRGEIDSRTTNARTAERARVLPTATSRGTSSTDTAVDETWHTEANVQAAGVTALASKGWRILSVAHSATKEHSIDVGRWFLEPPQFDGQRCGPGWICGGSGFLAGAAVGHHLGVIGVDLTRRAGLVIA